MVTKPTLQSNGGGYQARSVCIRMQFLCDPITNNRLTEEDKMQ